VSFDRNRYNYNNNEDKPNLAYQDCRTTIIIGIYSKYNISNGPRDVSPYVQGLCVLFETTIKSVCLLDIIVGRQVVRKIVKIADASKVPAVTIVAHLYIQL